MCSTVLLVFLCVVSVGLATSVGGSIEGEIRKAQEEIKAAELAKEALETKIECVRAKCKKEISGLNTVLKIGDESMGDDIKELAAIRSELYGGSALEKWLRLSIKLKEFDKSRFVLATELMEEDVRIYRERRRRHVSTECFRLERAFPQLLVRSAILSNRGKGSSRPGDHWELRRLRMILTQENNRRRELEKELKDAEEECKIRLKDFGNELKVLVVNLRGVLEAKDKAQIDLNDQFQRVDEASQELSEISKTLRESKRTYEYLRKELKEFKKERDCYEKLLADVHPRIS